MPDQELEVILPLLAAAARAQLAPNPLLDSAVERMTRTASQRGLRALVARLEDQAAGDAERWRRLEIVA